MADQLFSESAAVGSSEEIPDIFDVLEGGEDEGAVRFLLGFNGEEVSGVGFLSHVDSFGSMEVMDKYVTEGLNLGLTGSYLPALSAADQQQQHQHVVSGLPSLTQIKSPVAVRQAHSSLSSSSSSNSGKKRDTSGAKAIHNCDSCGKCFTTKFNLKRHINMHCHKSKENGVPIQGPPSASAPAKKTNEKSPSPSLSGLKSPDTVIAAMTGLNNLPQPAVSTAQMASHQTILPPSQSLLHSTIGEGHPAAPYPRAASCHSSPGSEEAEEFSAGPEPDSTYRLPSVQTLLPAVSNGYNTPTTVVVCCGTGGAGSTYSIMTTSCDSSHVVASSESSSINLPSSGTNNTDYGTLPADLFDPDSSKSEPPTTPPTSSKLGQTGLWVERGGGGRDEDEYEDELSAPPVTLTSIPAGWTKKVCFEGGRLRNKFCSPLGRLFTSHEEISQYFKTFNYSVPVGLFNFDAHFDEDDSEDEDDLEDSDEDEDSESTCAKRRKSENLGSEPLSPPPGTTPSPPLSSLTA